MFAFILRMKVSYLLFWLNQALQEVFSNIVHGNPAFSVYKNSQYWLKNVKTSFLHPRTQPSSPNTIGESGVFIL